MSAATPQGKPGGGGGGGGGGGAGAAPVPAIVLLSAKVTAGNAVHAQGLGTTLTNGSDLDATFTWDFGDASGAYNTLQGFNAAHIYDVPGAYKIKLTVTDKLGKTASTTVKVTVGTDTRKSIYISNAGNDANSGATPSAPIRTIARANALLSSNSKLLFDRGETYDLATGVLVSTQNVVIGAYGDAGQPQPVLRRASGSTLFELLKMASTASNVTIQDVALDTDTPLVLDKTGAPRGLTAAGQNIAIRNCTFKNVSDGVNAMAGPKGLLVENDVAPDDTSVRGYFLWAQGSDIVVLGNTCPNSTREHDLRIGGADRVLAAFNTFANIDRTALGDSQDIAKGTFTLQKGSFWTIDHNTVNAGPIGVGPLGGADGVGDPSARAKWVVVENNKVTGNFIGVVAGVEHVAIHDNVVWRDGLDAFNIRPIDKTTDSGGNPVYADRNAYDVSIINNTAFNNSNNGKFLYMTDPSAAGQITLTGNLYVAPNLETGYNQNSVVYVGSSDLTSFAKVNGNIWSIPAKVFWVAGAEMYVWTFWSDANGYLTAEQWNALPQVGDDVFYNVTLAAGTYQATVNGVTAGARLT